LLNKKLIEENTTKDQIAESVGEISVKEENEIVYEMTPEELKEKERIEEETRQRE